MLFGRTRAKPLSAIGDSVANPIETITLDSENGIAPAVHAIKLVGLEIGFQSYDLAEVCLAASEILTNAIRYAGQAELQIDPTINGKGIELTIRDHGPGIKDLAWAEIDGNTSWRGKSLGLGLGAARRCVDDMRIETNNSGTVVQLRSFLPLGSQDIETSVISFPAVNKSINADSVLLTEFNGDCLLAALIVGASSERTRDEIRNFLNNAKYQTLAQGLIQTHEYLKSIQEAGISVGLIRVTPDRIQARSVGDVAVQIWAEQTIQNVDSAGTLGVFFDATFPEIDVERRPNAQILMCSPGLPSPAWPDQHESLSAQAIARLLFNRYEQADRDSSVVVVRCVS